MAGTGRDGTNHGEVPHNLLTRINHSIDVRSGFHEPEPFAEGDVAEKVPGKEGNPISYITRLSPVHSIHETALKLVTKDPNCVVHDGLKLFQRGKGVKLLYRLDLLGVEPVASGAEDVLHDGAIGLHGVVD